jgi:hypothetical protein
METINPPKNYCPESILIPLKIIRSSRHGERQHTIKHPQEEEKDQNIVAQPNLACVQGIQVSFVDLV